MFSWMITTTWLAFKVNSSTADGLGNSASGTLYSANPKASLAFKYASSRLFPKVDISGKSGKTML